MDRRPKSYLPIVGFLLVALSAGASGLWARRELRAIRQQKSEPEGLPTGSKLPEWSSLAREATVLYPRPNAPVMLVFTDYQCPYCRALDAAIDTARLSGPLPLEVRIRHFPVAVAHPAARTAAIAVECTVGTGVLPAVHHAMFMHADSLDRTSIRRLVLALTPSQLRPDVAACIDAEATGQRVDSDLKMARELRLRGTPTIVVDGQVRYGAMPPDSIRMGFRPHPTQRD